MGDNYLMKTEKQNIHGRFTPPESGDAPQAVKRILDKVYNACREAWTAEHPDDKENTGNKQSCARIAWSAVKNAGWKKNTEGTWVKSAQNNNNAMIHTLRQMPTYDKRIETFDGRTYTVVPVVMMVEGVHAGSRGALYHSAEALGKIPDGWNGRPVVINHPQNEHGEFISANAPAVLEQYSVGYVFNARMNGTKLIAEAWLDQSRMSAVSPETNQAIEQGLVLEVSIGIYSDEEDTTGVWNGEEYIAIAYNHVPDHLAILPSDIGACSVDDGCGIRTNKANQNKTKNQSDMENLNINELVNQVRQEPDSDAILQLHKQGIILTTPVVHGSLTDIVDTLRDAVYSMDTDMEQYYVVEIFADYVIYKKRTEGQQSPTMWKHSYQVAADGSIIWVGAPIQVIQNITYVPVPSVKPLVQKQGILNKLVKLINNNKEVTEMEKNKCPKCAEKVEALIANTNVPFEECDRAWLDTLQENRLDEFAKQFEVKRNTPIGGTPVQSTDKVTEEMAFKALGIQNPAEWKAQTAFGLNFFKTHKDQLIKKIVENTNKETWTEEELNAMEFPVLQKIAASVKAAETPTHDYSILGAHTAQPVQQEQVAPMEMPGMIDLTKKKEE